jgi:hypothetical protein
MVGFSLTECALSRVVFISKDELGEWSHYAMSFDFALVYENIRQAQRLRGGEK